MALWKLKTHLIVTFFTNYESFLAPLEPFVKSWRDEKIRGKDIGTSFEVEGEGEQFRVDLSQQVLKKHHRELEDMAAQKSRLPSLFQSEV